MVKESKPKVKAGLEIHQQLDTGKLFCRCPSLLRKDEADWIVTRRLHAVAGEEGKVDVAAEHESKQEKEFKYEGYKNTNCLIEFDEEPPLEIDQEALKIAVQIGLLLNCKIIPVTQIMRKTVLDGSNTSGFQRTVLIARDGFLETSYGRVGIENLFLEEDAARIINKEENKAIFRLDRLGIPLIEIATAPDMSSAEQIKEAALKIGELVRTVKVRRGLGTIRQDLNISVNGFARTEIKGFQDPKMMIITVEKEIERQLKEGKKREPEVRKALESGETEFLRPMPGKSRMYPETDLLLLKINRKFIDGAKKELNNIKTKDQNKEDLKKKGLSEEMMTQLLNSNRLSEFEAILKVCNSPEIVAKCLLIYPKEIASHNNLEDINKKLTLDVIETILERLEKKEISEADIKKIMEKIALGEEVNKAVRVEKLDARHIESRIAEIIREKPGLSIGAYMGLIMAEFRGGVDGKVVMEILRKLVG